LSKLLLASLCLLLGACTGLPDNVRPVAGFDAQRYLGTWYEIARLDHSFERGLEQVTATYGLRDDGGFSVLNRGYKPAREQWKQAQGKAYPVGDPAVGHLKVSFFGPFYASYVIFDLGEDYQTAFVAGFNHKYLWMLARSPTVSQADKDRFVQLARDKGFDVSQLIWVQHP
jgi:apolipoprotein D and lipocalin family protein